MIQEILLSFDVPEGTRSYHVQRFDKFQERNYELLQSYQGRIQFIFQLEREIIHSQIRWLA